MRILTAAILAMLLASSAIAQDVARTGDWEVVAHSDTAREARTHAREDPVTFGVLCLRRNELNCFAFIAHDVVKCAPGVESAALMNSPAGSHGISTKCFSIPGTSLTSAQIIDEADIAQAAMRSGGEINILFAADAGQFEVFRFSTRGAEDAVKQARTFPQ